MVSFTQKHSDYLFAEQRDTNMIKIYVMQTCPDCEYVEKQVEEKNWLGNDISIFFGNHDNEYM